MLFHMGNSPILQVHICSVLPMIGCIKFQREKKKGHDSQDVSLEDEDDEYYSGTLVKKTNERKKPSRLGLMQIREVRANQLEQSSWQETDVSEERGFLIHFPSDSSLRVVVKL